MKELHHERSEEQGRLITGASTGIGAAVARALGKAGARVAVHYRGSRSEAEAVARDIETAGGEALLVQADVTDSASVDRMVQAVHQAFGRIDVLVNNAGGFVKRAPIVDADDDYIDAVFRLNARSVVAVSRRVIPLMAASGGGSHHQRDHRRRRAPAAGRARGCTRRARASFRRITRTMAKELVKDKIRVNAVAPGVIETPFHDGHSSPEVLKNFASAIPMGRLGTAEECIGAFMFLADA